MGIRWLYRGDPFQAATLQGRAMSELQTLHRLMEFQNLSTLSRSVRLNDGSIIHCQSVYGQDIIALESAVRPKRVPVSFFLPQEEKQLYETYTILFKNYYSIQSNFSTSHSYYTTISYLFTARESQVYANLKSEDVLGEDETTGKTLAVFYLASLVGMFNPFPNQAIAMHQEDSEEPVAAESFWGYAGFHGSAAATFEIWDEVVVDVVEHHPVLFRRSWVLDAEGFYGASIVVYSFYAYRIGSGVRKERITWYLGASRAGEEERTTPYVTETGWANLYWYNSEGDLVHSSSRAAIWNDPDPIPFLRSRHDWLDLDDPIVTSYPKHNDSLIYTDSRPPGILWGE